MRSQCSLTSRLAALLLTVGAGASVDVHSMPAGESSLGQWDLQLRYRYEHVEQESFSENADASTLRIRLNYATPVWRGLSGFAEVDYVTDLLADDYNSGGGTSPGKARFPVVADPTGDDLNQLWLRYAFSDAMHAIAGRQRIILDNQRFVGGVGWRQNEQTYDALSLRADLPGSGQFFYAYVDDVNRIFGNDVAAGDHAQTTHLVNAEWKLPADTALTTYYYHIDDRDAPAFSTRTAGLQLQGSFDVAKLHPEWLLEFAHQQDESNNPVDYTAHYWHARLALPLSQIRLFAGQEVLSGDSASPDAAFRTPLATLHAFNGWADQFLTTPNAGLVDRYVGVAGVLGGWNWRLIGHTFDAESGSGNYGKEVDIAWRRPLGQGLSLLLKAADFRADSLPFTDTRKLWLMLDFEV